MKVQKGGRPFFADMIICVILSATMAIFLSRDMTHFAKEK